MVGETVKVEERMGERGRVEGGGPVSSLRWLMLCQPARISQGE